MNGQFDFDSLVNRRGSGCYKWDMLPADDVIAAWVADMDFKAAPPILEALRRRVEHGVFGYCKVCEEYYRAVIDWFERRHGWHIERESMLYTTGVVPAISAIIKALAAPGDEVLLLTPVYNCFFSSIRNNGCRVAEVPLACDDRGYYTVDWEAFEAALSRDSVKHMILCNPHNPACRVWTRDELLRLGRLCVKHGVTVICDEIHCEFVQPGYRYVPYGTLGDDLLERAVVCTSASKAFNIAGLQMANIVCVNHEWRAAIDRAININEVCDVNPFGPVATIAAYNECGDWIDALNAYVGGNYALLRDRLLSAVPQLVVSPLEGTYLAWVDCRVSGLTSEQIVDRLTRQARVQVSAGSIYGAAGEGFIRINLATQRSRVAELLDRIEPVLKTMCHG